MEGNKKGEEHMNEIKNMQTPWDSDKILMVDIGCYERGCVCVANQWDANYKSECVPMVEYKEWVGLTNEEVYEIYKATEKLVGEHWDNGGTILMFPTTLYQAFEAKLKERNT